MRTSHLVLSWLIVFAFVTLWVAIPLTTGFNPAEGLIWDGIMSVATLAMIIMSCYAIPIDRIVVAVFAGVAYKSYSRITGGAGSPALFDLLAWIFPWPINTAIYLPATSFTVPYQTAQANTKEADDDPSCPDKMYIEITFLLSDDIEGNSALLQSIPLVKGAKGRNRNDLSTPHKISYIVGIDPDTGKPIPKDFEVPCIGAILGEELEPALSESANRTLPDFTQSQAIANDPAIEARLMANLQGTIFERAKLLRFEPIPGAAATDPIEKRYAVSPGQAVRLIDINVKLIFPADPETARAMSAKAKATLLKKAKIVDAEGDKQALVLHGEGEAALLREVAAQLKTPEGRFARASQTLTELPKDTTLIAGVDVVDATLAKLVKGSKNTP